MNARARIAALAAALFLTANPASAQLFRAYLALDGNDANPCTLTSPCRLLPAALTAVAEGGEIWMLDSANYNSFGVTVTKGVTILAVPGALGSVLALGAPALTISTTSDVTLRNLNILPFPGNEGFSGLVKQGAGRLTLQDSNVFGLGFGMFATDGAKVTIARTTFRKNGGGVIAGSGASVGISDSLFADNLNYGADATAGASSTTTLTVTRSVAQANGNGFSGSAAGNGTVRLHVVDSTMDANTNLGVAIAGPVTASVHASVTGSLITGSPTGAFAQGLGDVRLFLASTTIQSNTFGVFQGDAAVVETAGNNAIRNNGTNVSGTVTNVGGN